MVGKAAPDRGSTTRRKPAGGADPCASTPARSVAGVLQAVAARHEASDGVAHGTDSSLDPRVAAKAARLHYVTDAKAGITRVAEADG